MTRTWMTVQPPPVPRDPPASIEWAPSPASAHLDAQVQTEGMLGGDVEGKREPQAACWNLAPRSPTGLLCHLEDMCLSQPCHVNAQCSTNPLTGSTLCICQPGYSGPTCHQDLDECQMGEGPPQRP